MIRILGSARRDLDEAYAFYEAKATGLGDYFLSSIKADIQSLKFSAGIHRLIDKEYYRLLCKKFPFAIYYSVKGSETTVYAVIDCRRDPAWVRKHLGPSDEGI